MFFKRLLKPFTGYRVEKYLTLVSFEFFSCTAILHVICSQKILLNIIRMPIAVKQILWKIKLSLYFKLKTSKTSKWYFTGVKLLVLSYCLPNWLLEIQEEENENPVVSFLTTVAIGNNTRKILSESANLRFANERNWKHECGSAVSRY